MKRATQRRTGPFRLALLAVSMSALTACEEGFGSGLSDGPEPEAAGEQTPQSKPRGKPRDVEAPEVFQVTEAALWDGRPSLGGIWVAHPDVGQPERVRIRNTANNKSVEGALFRRERANPGPLVQVSSDAAEQLGMLAGAPVTVKVVALRREEVKPEPAPAPKVEEEPAKTEDKKIETTTLAAAGTATAAGAVAATATTEAADATQAAAPKKTPWWKRRRDKSEVTQGEPELVAGAAAAIAASEAADGKPASGNDRITISKPYVQIGAFNVEKNAKTAMESARASGLDAEIRPLKTEDKTVWRVVVGPVKTRAERRELLAKVDAIGFTDSYVVKN